MIVLDTNILIDILAGIDPWSSWFSEALPGGRLATTAISRFELRSGASEGAAADRTLALLRPLAVLPFDRDAADRAGEVGARLRREGLPLPMADLAIAGICLELGSALLTRNRRHFERIEGLRLHSGPAGT